MAASTNWYSRWVMTSSENKLSIRQITLFGMLGALTFGAKFAMSWLPNIEPVSLMVMVFAVTMGVKALYPIYVYALLELLVYGFGGWNLVHIYIWAPLWLAAWLLRSVRNPVFWAILSGTFGLLFGALSSLIYIPGGWAMVAAKWITGLSFDLLHCAGNFVIALILFEPVRKLVEKLYHHTQAQ